MLLSSRDALRVGLSPHKVVLLLTRGSRVVKRRALDSALASASEEPWRPALRSLDAALPEFAQRGRACEVVLSNHFVHYALVPAAEELTSEWEQTAYVRVIFAKALGSAADELAFRVCDDGSTMHVASAVNQAMLEQLTDLVVRQGLRLQSVQPHLMAAFNRWRGRIRAKTAWFVLVEDERMSVGLLHRDRWRSLRSMRAGNHWEAELPHVLERELLLVEADDIPRDRAIPLYLCAPGIDTPRLPPDFTSLAHVLSLNGVAGYEPMRDAEYALAWGH